MFRRIKLLSRKKPIPLRIANSQSFSWNLNKNFQFCRPSSRQGLRREFKTPTPRSFQAPGPPVTRSAPPRIASLTCSACAKSPSIFSSNRTINDLIVSSDKAQIGRLHLSHLPLHLPKPHQRARPQVRANRKSTASNNAVFRVSGPRQQLGAAPCSYLVVGPWLYRPTGHPSMKKEP